MIIANDKTVRCAVYTRKSTDENLQLEFNSLDAQREAAEAYIASQKHAGWVCLAERYDDGGFSGGKWTARLVTRLLRSPVYLGRFAAPNGDRAGSHDAIVPQELFDAAQAQLAGRRTSSSTSRAAVRFPLRGKILCPRCGRPLSTYTLTKPVGARAKKTLRYYRCRSTAGGRRPCRGVSYPAWELEQFVREQLASEAAWQEILRQAKASPRMASELAHLWQAMGHLTQDNMLPSVVQEVRFLEGNSSIAIRLNRTVVENIKAFFSGACARDC